MSRPLNKRNRVVARNQLRKAVLEVYRQQLAFWRKRKGQGKRQARSDVRCQVGAILSVWCH